jgi:outer membrane protein
MRTQASLSSAWGLRFDVVRRSPLEVHFERAPSFLRPASKKIVKFCLCRALTPLLILLSFYIEIKQHINKKGEKMKKFLCPLFVLIALCFLPVSAVAADSFKVGVVDLQRCIQESIEGKRAKDKLQATKDDMQKKLDERQNKLLEIKKELEKQSMMLSMDAKEDKEKEFERQRREFKYFYDDISNQMRKAEAEVRKVLLEDLAKVVGDIGAKGKFTLILERRSSGIMYLQNTIDITDEVLKAYDLTKK